MSNLDELEQIAAATAFGFNGPLTHTKRERKEHCAGGHPWTEETTKWRRGRGKRYRECKICRRERRNRTLAQSADVASNRSAGPSLNPSDFVAAHVLLDGAADEC